MRLQSSCDSMIGPPIDRSSPNTQENSWPTSLVRLYATKPGHTVYGITRSNDAPDGFPLDIKWLPGIDLMDQDVGDTLVTLLGGSQPLAAVVSHILIS